MIRGSVKLPSSVAGGVLEASGIKVPIIDLTEIENGGHVYDCDVVTADEATRSSLRDTYETLRPVLERAYPRIKQVGDILGNLLDLAEQESESLLDSTPTP